MFECHGPTAFKKVRFCGILSILTSWALYPFKIYISLRNSFFFLALCGKEHGPLKSIHRHLGYLGLGGGSIKKIQSIYP